MPERYMSTCHRYRLSRLAATPLLAMLWPIAAAHAATCNLDLSPPHSEVGPYDPFGDALTGSISVDASSPGDPCETDLVLVDRNGAPLRELRFDGQTIPIELRLVPGDGVASLADDASAHVVTAGPGKTVRIRWQLRSVGPAVLAPGEHASNIEVRAPEAASSGDFTIRVPAKALINFAGGSLSQTIDLGTLQPGKSGRAVLQVRANTRPMVSMTSANRGVLVNSSSADSRIPYSLTLDGSPVNLGSPFQQSIDMPMTLAGRSLEIVVTIGEFRGAMAGSYRDDVTIDISP